MFSRSLKKPLLISAYIKLSACRNASRRQPTYIEADRVEQNPVEPFLRTAIQRKMTQPFSEVKEDTFFNAVIKSFAPLREGPPKRISWNKDTFTWENFKRRMKFRKREYDIFQQRYLHERHDQLGNEIAAAHFIVFRGGGVKFYGENKWVKMNKGDDVETYDKNLPKKFTPSVYLEGIDASGMELFYEGLENIHKLANLKWLSLRGCKETNDWHLDKLCNEFGHSLEHLDISDCHNVTYRGLVALCKVNNLSQLIVNNIADSYEFQLSCVMLQDVFPNLNIEGVSYVSMKTAVDHASDTTNTIDNEGDFHGKHDIKLRKSAS